MLQQFVQTDFIGFIVSKEWAKVNFPFPQGWALTKNTASGRYFQVYFILGSQIIRMGGKQCRLRRKVSQFHIPAVWKCVYVLMLAISGCI